MRLLNQNKMIKWIYKPNGNCPVQSEGYFMGWYFYFRSRYNKTTIEFSKTEAGWEDNLIHGKYVLWTTKDPYKAGWLKPNFCKVLIWIGCIRFFFQRNKQNLK